MAIADWNLLTRTFCPQVNLSRTSPYKDDYWPCGVDWYTQRCTMLDTNDPSFEIVHPTLDELGQNPQSTRYLEPDGDFVRSGAADSARMYAHIRRSPGVAQDWIDIQYWFFYAYNGRIGGPIPVPIAGAHEGDWEHVTVRLSNWRAGVGATIEAVFFAAHGRSEGKWLLEPASTPTGGHYSLDDGSHVRVYSAWHSHASYENPGLHWREVTGYFAQDYASGGYAWGPSSVAELVAVDADLDPSFAPASWLAYGGRWGSTGPDAEGSPRGPAQQGVWTDDGANGFYVALDPLATFGSDWGSKREATAVGLGVLGGRNVLAVGRDAGDNTRVKVYGWEQDDLVQVAAGGSDWGTGRGATGVALGLFADRPTLGVSRTQGDNSRFYLYTMPEEDGGQLSVLASGGSDWGHGYAATGIAIGALGGEPLVGVTRSSGDNSRFKLYRWTGGALEVAYAGGGDWSSSRAATGIAFGTMNGRDVVGVTRTGGNNSRFYLYALESDGSLVVMANGGSDWGDGRSATSIAFGVLDDRAACIVGRTKGSNSRFYVYVWDDARAGLVELVSGGVDWSSGATCTDVAFGMVNGDGVIAVSRTAESSSEVFVYKYVGSELVELGETGSDWGQGRYATSVAIGRLGGREVVAYGRSEGDHSRGGVLEWVV